MKRFFLCLLLLIPIKVSALDSAKASIVMDIDSGRVLYEKNANKKMLIASTTKIMTAIIAIENGDLDNEVTARDEILKMYGTSIYLEYNEKMKIIDLLYGLLLRSGNDAAVVIANNICNSEEEFVKLMNKKAKEIGMNNTYFSNVHGLDEESENYSTAYDMAILSRYAYKNKTYRLISKTKKYEVQTNNKSYLWINRNKLLFNYKYCTGGKNGYTPKAGKTLVSTASKNGLNITIVSLNDSNIYDNHKELYQSIYNNYHKYMLVDKNNFSISKSLFDGKLYLKKSFFYPLREDELSKVRIVEKISSKEYKDGDRVGIITILLRDKTLGNIYIYAKKNN